MDIRDAARALVRSRGFTALAIVTLVLAAATRVIAIGAAIGLAAAAVLGTSAVLGR